MVYAFQTILNLAARELRVLPRRSRWRLKRVLVVLTCAAVLYVPYLQSAVLSISARGLALFQFLCPIAALLSVLTAPIMAGTSVSQDREAHTLELLCLTPASSWQLIAGRVVGAMGQASLIVLALLPMLMLCISMGGVSFVQILLACLLILCIIFAGSCLGILVALAIPERWPQEMVSMVASACYFVLFPMVVWGIILEFFPGVAAAGEVFVGLFSPARSVIELVTAGDLYMVFANCASMVAMGLVMILVACNLLRRRVMLGDVRQPAPKGTAQSRASRRIDGNPIRSRDYFCAYSGKRSGWAIVGLMVITPILTTLWIGVTHRSLDDDLIAFIFGVVLGEAVLFWSFLFVWRCAHAFALEARRGVVDMMLLTDMDPSELEAGKRRAVLDSLSPMYLATPIALVCYLAAPGKDWGEQLLAVFLVLYALLSAYAGGCLAIYLSLRVGRFAFIVCLASLVGVLFIHAFGMLPISAVAAMLVYVPAALLSQHDPGWTVGAVAMFVGGSVQLAILVGVSYLFRLHTRFHLQQLTHRSN